MRDLSLLCSPPLLFPPFPLFCVLQLLGFVAHVPCVAVSGTVLTRTDTLLCGNNRCCDAPVQPVHHSPLPPRWLWLAWVLAVTLWQEAAWGFDNCGLLTLLGALLVLCVNTRRRGRTCWRATYALTLGISHSPARTAPTNLRTGATFAATV